MNARANENRSTRIFPACLRLRVSRVGEILDVCEGWGEVIGYSTEELSVLQLDEFIAAPSKEEFHKFLKTCGPASEQQSITCTFRCKDQSSINATLSPVVTRNSSGNDEISFTVSIHTPIVPMTDDFSFLLEESEERIRGIADLLPVGVIIYEYDCILYANRIAHQFFEVDESLLIGSSLANLIYPADRETLLKRMKEIGKGSAVETMKVRYLDGKSGVSVFSMSFKEIVFKKKRVILGIFQDVTNEELSQKRFAESEKRFRKMFQTIPDGVALMTRDGRIVQVNSGFQKTFGYELKEVIGRAASKINLWVVEDEWKTILEEMENLDNTLQHHESQCRAKDGSIHTCDLLASQIILGNEEHFLVVFHSMDEVQKLQDQLYQSQKLEELGRLTGSVAHDLNNILTVILGNISFAEIMTGSGEATIDDLTKIREEVKLASERAAALTGQLLAFSRKQLVEEKQVDLHSLLEESSRLIRHLIPENVTIRVNNPGTLPSTIMADPTHVQQVILNLVVNAVHAMPQGGELDLELFQYIPDKLEVCSICEKEIWGNFVGIRVKDTGHGISLEHINSIFMPFFTTKERGQGTGLGLSTVASIMKRHKGHIMVQSEVGKGSDFKVVFPRVEAKTGKDKPESDVIKTLPTGKERILVVDDDLNIRKLINNVLRQRGYKSQVVKTGEEAFELCLSSEERFDLVITDIMMPGMNGIELSKKIRAVNSGAKILCMSGYVDSPKLVEDLQRENIPLLPKPFNTIQLLEKVREVLEKAPV